MYFAALYALFLLGVAPTQQSRACPAESGADVTREQQIQHVLGAIYKGDDKAVDRELSVLKQMRPEFPAAAHYRALRDSWRAAEDPGNPVLSANFEKDGQEAITLLESWTAAHPRDAEGWRYLASAWGQQSQFAVSVKPSPIKALLAGKHMYKAISQAVIIDPSSSDALLGIGAWDYFTAKVPLFIRPLAVLLLGSKIGNRDTGIEELNRAIECGQHTRIEAAMVLASAYWSEADYSEFEKVIETHIIPAFPRIVSVRTWQVSGWICAGKLDNARDVANRSEIGPDWRDFQLGRAAFAGRDWSEADRLFGLALGDKGQNRSFRTWAHVGQQRARAQSKVKITDPIYPVGSSDIWQDAVPMSDMYLRMAGKCPH